jgi:hypothetical protein
VLFAISDKAHSFSAHNTNSYDSSPIKYLLEFKDKFENPSDTEKEAWKGPIPKKIRGKNLVGLSL